MKIIFILILSLIAIIKLIPTTPEIVIKHHGYITYYNSLSKEADSVSWDLGPQNIGCPDQSRKDAFKADPLIPGSAKPEDYAVNSSDPKSPKYKIVRAAWIDEGHLYSYQDAMCDNINKVECFYMSNMAPQLHAFNAGDWKTLEVQERIFAKTKTLHIIAGVLGSIGKLPAGENIPAYFYKAILTDGKYVCWIMPNAITSVSHNYTYWEVSAANLDFQTGLKL